MKIYVSKEFFNSRDDFIEPMRLFCGVFIDETLRLGQIIIESEEGRVLIEQEPPKDNTKGDIT